MTLLADIEAIGVAEVRGEPGEPALAPHVHGRHTESFYVLDGELALLGGDREVHAPAGSWVQVPPGVTHTVAVRGDGPPASSASTRRAAASARSCARSTPRATRRRRRRRAPPSTSGPRAEPTGQTAQGA